MSGVDFNPNINNSYSINNYSGDDIEDTSEDTSEEGSGTSAVPSAASAEFLKRMVEASVSSISSRNIPAFPDISVKTKPDGSIEVIVEAKEEAPSQADLLVNIPQTSVTAGDNLQPTIINAKLWDLSVSLDDKEGILDEIYEKASPITMETYFPGSSDYRLTRMQENYIEWLPRLENIANDISLPLPLRYKAANYVISCVYHDDDKEQPAPLTKPAPWSKEKCIREELDKRACSDHVFVDRSISSLMASDLDPKMKLDILDRYYNADPDNAIVLIAKFEISDDFHDYAASKIINYRSIAGDRPKADAVMAKIFTSDEAGTDCRNAAFEYFVGSGGPRSLAFLKEGKWLWFGTTKLEDIMASNKLDIGFKLNVIASYIDYCDRNGDAEGYQLAASIINKEGMRPALMAARINAPCSRVNFTAYDNFIFKSTVSIALAEEIPDTYNSISDNRISRSFKLIDIEIESLRNKLSL